MKDLRVSFPEPCSERWENMAPSGCNRHCASCDKVIHDLSAMTIEETEALLRIDPEPCVRAVIGADGAIASRISSTSRRIRAAIGASAVFATAACQSVSHTPRATLTGQVSNTSDPFVVKARDNFGRTYRGVVGDNSSYQINGVYYGTYTITISGSCGHLERTESVLVRDPVVDLGTIEWPGDCIIVGMMLLDPEGRG